ncbi:MAG: hypothetical protein HUJ26_24835 [Planctomycetaceae bacterium]|nr:hypothetical protein [Planctomycetaceae bacterium]
MSPDFSQFDDAPSEVSRLVYDVPYIEQEFEDGGLMWLTRYGWPWRDHLAPEKWYTDKQYVNFGTRLTRGTGAVYRVGTVGDDGRVIDLVVKFSRFAQDVPLHITVTYPGNIPHHLVDNSRFNSPFYEFGQIKKIRMPSENGTPRIMTGRPLAIYSPPREHKLWQLGRTQLRFNHYARLLELDQKQFPEHQRLQLNIHRQYIVLFSWEKGDDAELAFLAGKLTEKQLFQMTEDVQNSLERKGFYVLDNKPRHYIVRTRKNGELLQKDGRIAYSLVDFELLIPIPDSSLLV